jgi:hypothetical protein
VTVDSMIRSLLALGATSGEIGKLIKRVETRRAAYDNLSGTRALPQTNRPTGTLLLCRFPPRVAMVEPTQSRHAIPLTSGSHSPICCLSLE